MQINQVQKQAILYKDGPMLVLAGPGSGKTLVITERTKCLIREYHIPEDNILVITFTKAATNEMRGRFLKGMGADRTKVSFGTFHAIFYTILKHAYHLNSSNIIREDERLFYLKEIVHNLQIEYEDEKDFISELLSEISLVKSNQIELANYYSINCADEIFRSIYTEYNQKLRRANRIDFEDMLLLCYELLSQRKDILAAWQNKYRYILVDEFQDINKVQYDIIRLLAAPQNNLFVVGDDDQSIYRFRGAKPEIMLNFPVDYPECGKLFLNMNYRSKANIIHASNRLINHNNNRYIKEVQAVLGEGHNIIICDFETTPEESQMLAEEVLKLNKEGMMLSDMAILVRTNRGSGSLLHKLMEYNIPFRMRDSLPNIFDHWIAVDILTYIKIALGGRERGLFLQVINRPKRYVSRECFDTPEVNIEDIKDYYEDKNWMLERLSQLEYDIALLSGMRPYAAVNYIRHGIGYDDFLKEYAEFRKMNVEELLDILEELLDSARDYKSYEDWFAYMEEYRQELKHQASASQSVKSDSVTIATMHSSKGLEFEAVFIVDANEGVTPHKKAALSSDIEEERRLFYVAMTRAKEYLYLLSVKNRYNKVSQRSRFIDEIEEAQQTQEQ
ncbi:MAG TPA: ATP-dependent helicase [Mobilitalea sp.]|nr:ATP-dependent helicase [Mobilitalea sp.]